MSTADFHAVLESFSDDQRPAQPATTLPRVAVLGGGIDGRATAAWCMGNGAESVTLFSVYRDDIDALGQGIRLRGEAPIGNYNITLAPLSPPPAAPTGPRQSNGQRAEPSNTADPSTAIVVTSILEDAIAEADLVIVTGSVLKQRTYGLVLAQHLSPGQVLLLAPGRTFGGLETTWWLRIGGASAQITVAELSNLPYLVEPTTDGLQLRTDTAPIVATLPSLRAEVTTALASYFPTAKAAPTLFHSSFADYTGTVDAVISLLGGTVVNPVAPLLPGAVPVVDRCLAETVTATHRGVIAQLIAERQTVAERWGVRDLPDPSGVIEAVVGDTTAANARPIPTEAVARSKLRDAVLGSLVPLASAAQPAGIEVPVTNSLIGMAEAVLGGDLRTAGRRLDRMGIDASSMGTVRKTVDELGIGWS